MSVMYVMYFFYFIFFAYGLSFVLYVFVFIWPSFENEMMHCKRRSLRREKSSLVSPQHMTS